MKLNKKIIGSTLEIDNETLQASMYKYSWGRRKKKNVGGR